MAIRKFEYMHGAVLTKLMRNDRPVALRLVETNQQECWSLYRVNVDINLMVKYATSHRQSGRGRTWTFILSAKQREYLAATERVWLALVCGATDLDDAETAVALLEPKEANLLLATGTTPNVSIRMASGKQLRVTINGYAELVVPRNRLETWEVPGS